MVVCPHCKSHNIDEISIYNNFKHDHEENSLADRILDIRQFLNITQKEMGRYLDIGELAVAKWEKGATKMPMPKTLAKIEKLERKIEQGEPVDVVPSKLNLIFYHRNQK